MQKPTQAPATPDTTLPDRFDVVRFHRLIELAGPSLAPTLMLQLDEDLGTCRRRFEAALESSDFAGIRQASHDLIALAGSCGAEALHDLAKTVNDYAHRSTFSPILALQGEIDSQLEALLSVVRTALVGRA